MYKRSSTPLGVSGWTTQTTVRKSVDLSSESLENQLDETLGHQVCELSISIRDTPAEIRPLQTWARPCIGGIWPPHGAYKGYI